MLGNPRRRGDTILAVKELAERARQGLDAEDLTGVLDTAAPGPTRDLAETVNFASPARGDVRSLAALLGVQLASLPVPPRQQRQEDLQGRWRCSRALARVAPSRSPSGAGGPGRPGHARRTHRRRGRSPTRGAVTFGN